MSQTSNPLPSIVLCGYERGGTTLLSEIFRHNGYFSGFEVGVLMCDTPSDFLNFKPYSAMLHAGWGLGERITLEELCSGSFEHFYTRLIKTAYPKRAHLPFFDKTPIYMSRLGAVLHRTSFIDKAVVITRDPRSVFVSWAKRQLGDRASPKTVNTLVRNRLRPYSRRYLDYFIGCITHRDSADVLFVSYENLCLHSDQSLKTIGAFADGRPFALDKLEKRYNNVYGDGIEQSRVREFESFLDDDTEKKVLESTALASRFFADPSEVEKYGNIWADTENKILAVLRKHDLSSRERNVAGSHFEPETYLLRYPDVLKKRLSPAVHYAAHGKKEGRLPS